MAREEYGTDGNVYQMSISNGKEYSACGDAVSREAVLNYIRDNYRRWFINDDAFMQCVNGIKDIASVTPQQNYERG